MSDMKCPFCGKKLWYDEQDGVYRCMKSACVMDYEGGTEKQWQELIRTRKALEKIKKVVDGFGWGCGNMHLPDYHDGLIIREIVNEALEQKDV